MVKLSAGSTNFSRDNEPTSQRADEPTSQRTNEPTSQRADKSTRQRNNDARESRHANVSAFSIGQARPDDHGFPIVGPGTTMPGRYRLFVASTSNRIFRKNSATARGRSRRRDQRKRRVEKGSTYYGLNDDRDRVENRASTFSAFSKRYAVSRTYTETRAKRVSSIARLLGKPVDRRRLERFLFNDSMRVR